MADPTSRSDRSLILFWFLAANYVLSLAIAYPYLAYGPERAHLLPWLEIRLTFLGHFAALTVVLGLLLWPLTALIRSRTLLLVWPPAVLFVYQLLLMADVRIYSLFRFHINGLVINTLTTEGSWDSVTLGRATIAASLAAAAALALAEWGGMALLLRRGPRMGWRVPLLAVACALVLITTEKLAFAYANFYDRLEVTRYQRLFPLYRPLLLDQTIERHLGWEKPPPLVTATAPTGGLLRYPAGTVDFDINAPGWNIVWIVVESWRADSLNDELMPSLSAFGRRAKVFDRHYSGGNATRFGIFSLFYGLYGSYWHQFLAERRSPVFMDGLNRLGYEFWIASSTQLSYPEFRDTAFVNVPQSAIDDRLPGAGATARDPVMAERFEQFLDQPRDRPFFAFLFPDSPHAPYHYPPEFERYRPVTEQINYFSIKKGDKPGEVEGLYNRYRNSVSYTDTIVSRMVRALEERGQLDRTIIVITGDHGQEFFETGYLGHNSAFSTYQTMVPMILYWPGVKPGRESRLTSHLDVVPTMFDLLGVRADPALYSQGRSLLGGEEHRFVVVSGWDTLGIIDSDSTLVLSTESYNAGMIEARVSGYLLADDPRRVVAARSRDLMDLTRGLGNFLR
jgi:membrane-anchored protein YejM (alkaline phosphatase superfamily)